MRRYSRLRGWSQRLARIGTGWRAIGLSLLAGGATYLFASGPLSSGARAIELAVLISVVVVSILEYVALRQQLGETGRMLDESRTARLAGFPSGQPALGPVPEPLAVPGPLVDALQAGSCALYAGSDFAVLAGMPHRERILAALLGEASVDDSQRASLYRALEQGNSYLVADVLAAEFGRQRLGSLLSEMVGGVSVDVSSSIMRAFKRVPFSGAVTDMWYDVLERLYVSREPITVIPERGEAEASLVRRGKFYISHLYGYAPRPESVRFPVENYRPWANDREFARFIETVFASQSVLFIGSTEREILQVLPEKERADGPPHFAVLPWDVGLPAQAARLERLGVKVLPFTRGIELEAFAGELALVGRQRTDRDLQPAPPIRRIHLTNIGPYRSLDIAVDPGVTVLLGDNGSGKSSILRAISLALMGENSGVDAVCSELLRVGTSTGRIELRLDDEIHTAEIHRDRQGAHLETNQISPIEAGLWLALGFSPQRGTITGEISGPLHREDPDPSVEDLRPLATNSSDGRLSDLEQWLVNTAVSADSPGTRGETARRTLALFFPIVADLTPGVEFTYEGVDRGTWRVLLGTPDGQVTISQLSGGMAAVLGWVGVLVQRLVEVEGASEPAKARALLLVDEVDLHLHPAWQREILPILRKRFPGLQIIVSTHSPLVVGSLHGATLIHLARGDDGPVARIVEEDYRGWRSDQILTGGAFELSTTRDRDTEDRIRTYRELDARDDPQAREAAARLADSLHHEIPRPQETRLGRDAAALVDKALEQQLENLEPSDRDRLERAAEEYLAYLRRPR